MAIVEKILTASVAKGSVKLAEYLLKPLFSKLPGTDITKWLSDALQEALDKRLNSNRPIPEFEKTKKPSQDGNLFAATEPVPTWNMKYVGLALRAKEPELNPVLSFEDAVDCLTNRLIQHNALENPPQSDELRAAFIKELVITALCEIRLELPKHQKACNEIILQALEKNSEALQALIDFQKSQLTGPDANRPLLLELREVVRVFQQEFDQKLDGLFSQIVEMQKDLDKENRQRLVRIFHTVFQKQCKFIRQQHQETQNFFEFISDKNKQEIIDAIYNYNGTSQNPISTAIEHHQGLDQTDVPDQKPSSESEPDAELKNYVIAELKRHFASPHMPKFREVLAKQLALFDKLDALPDQEELAQLIVARPLQKFDDTLSMINLALEGEMKSFKNDLVRKMSLWESVKKVHEVLLALPFASRQLEEIRTTFNGMDRVKDKPVMLLLPGTFLITPACYHGGATYAPIHLRYDDEGDQVCPSSVLSSRCLDFTPIDDPGPQLPDKVHAFRRALYNLLCGPKSLLTEYEMPELERNKLINRTPPHTSQNWVRSIKAVLRASSRKEEYLRHASKTPVAKEVKPCIVVFERGSSFSIAAEPEVLCQLQQDFGKELPILCLTGKDDKGHPSLIENWADIDPMLKTFFKLKPHQVSSQATQTAIN